MDANTAIGGADSVRRAEGNDGLAYLKRRWRIQARRLPPGCCPRATRPRDEREGRLRPLAALTERGWGPPTPGDGGGGPPGLPLPVNRNVSLSRGTTTADDCWAALAYLRPPRRLVRGPSTAAYQQAFAQYEDVAHHLVNVLIHGWVCEKDTLTLVNALPPSGQC